MSIATLIRRMSEIGASAEMIALAVEEIEAGQTSLNARRVADRDRKRDQREAQKAANVTGHGGDSPQMSAIPPCPPTPPLKVAPDPFKITPPIPPKPTTETRGRRLTDDWRPTPLTGKALAMIERWQPGEVEREIAKFRNYWIAKPGKDACKTEWQRTWINWLISADERKPRHGGQSQSPGIGSTERAMQSALASIESRGPGASFAD